MSVPNHGYDCQTLKYYGTTCSFCKNKVYYFECSCGSKVFLETSWLRHDCRGFNNIKDLFSNGESPINEYVIRRLIAKHNHKNKKQNRHLTPADFFLLWMDYFDSLEWFNLCGNCQKPIKTRRANVERKIFGTNNDNSVIIEKISCYGDISAHYQVFDELGNPVFNPFHKGRIIYKFVEKYRVLNAKCNCPYKERRKSDKHQ